MVQKRAKEELRWQASAGLNCGHNSLSWKINATYINSSISVSHQVSNSKNPLKLFSHGVVLHGHEESIEDNTDGDGQVNKWVHDNQVDYVLDLQPDGRALPDEEDVGKLVPTGRALPLRLLQLCRKRWGKNKGGEEQIIVVSLRSHKKQNVFPLLLCLT